MDSLAKPGEFFLGKNFDMATGHTVEKSLIYEADDLTTHGVVVGMTGSGKTGLCIGLLEEAALNGIPAMMIDPKGDLTNLLLHFPDLLPQDFKPWVNPDLGRRSGLGLDEVAQQEADKWRKGLADWGIVPERLEALKNSAQFTIYTPGSDSGMPVSILASLKAPTLPWESNRELFREKISGTVTALLGLVGFTDVDPVRSREHILLANIFENAWKAGQDLDLGELILQTQNPPFKKLGVFDVNTFYPQKDRFDLAMQLNNILASPSFEAWIEGQPLDVASLLYTPEGKPRHTIFYIAHLSDTERMFFVTLLFSAMEAWMRSQSGTPSLRALVYFDEIFGYLPPVRNPASKQVMLRLLKQARAFGVGLVLATQNPADVDYKGLSNTGSWFIGKLQTDQDKQRLLDGLEGAVAGSFNRNEFDKIISNLGKRVFLLHNVHEKGPILFQTRWAMNYLAGPLTRAQIPALNRLEEVTAAPPVGVGYNAQADAAGVASGQKSTVPVTSTPITKPLAKPATAKPLSAITSTTRSALPMGVDEYFLPANLSFTQAFKASGRQLPEQARKEGLVYRPVLLGLANIQFVDRRYNVDVVITPTVIVSNPNERGMVRWEDYHVEAIKPASLDAQPGPGARFTMLEAPLTDAKIVSALKKDFVEWVYRTIQVSVRVNEALKVYADPEVSPAEFRELCAKAARSLRDGEVKELQAGLKKRKKVLQDKLVKEARELTGDQSELNQRKMEELGTNAEMLLSLFGGRRRKVSTSLTKRRQTAQAKASVEESKDVIADLTKEIAVIDQEEATALKEVEDKFAEMVGDITEISLSPLKKDILLDAFGIAWSPYYLAEVAGEVVELPAFESGA